MSSLSSYIRLYRLAADTKIIFHTLPLSSISTITSSLTLFKLLLDFFFSQVSSGHHLSPHFSSIKSDKDLTPIFSMSSTESDDAPFPLRSVMRYSHAATKVLPCVTTRSVYFLVLLAIFNNIWMAGNFPPHWSEALVLPFLKPNKPGSQDYRPITFTNSQRMVNFRLMWYLEHHLISPNQFGFRRDRSPADSLAYFQIQITPAFARCHSVLPVFSISKRHMIPRAGTISFNNYLLMIYAKTFYFSDCTFRV